MVLISSKSNGIWKCVGLWIKKIHVLLRESVCNDISLTLYMCGKEVEFKLSCDECKSVLVPLFIVLTTASLSHHTYTV